MERMKRLVLEQITELHSDSEHFEIKTNPLYSNSNLFSTYVIRLRFKLQKNKTKKISEKVSNICLNKFLQNFISQLCRNKIKAI